MATSSSSAASTVRPVRGQIARRSLTDLQRNPRFFLAAVFLLAIAVRLLTMLVKRSYHLADYGDDHFSFGWEMGRVARSLAEGQGFSSPMPLPTGPTAIVGPLYPLLLALIFKLFGVYSTASAVVVLILQSVFSSLTCLFIYLCGRDTVGKGAGKIGALVWAVFPLSIFFTVSRIWETSITPTLAAALFWCMLPLRQSASISRWAAVGVLLGFSALINTSLILLAVPFVVSAVWNNRLRVWRHVAALALSFVAVSAPWLIRNYIQFGGIMLRSNFPLEFRVANNEWSRGQKIEALHPATAPDLNQHWRDVGEKRFMAEESALNSRFVMSHPGRFAFSTLNRIVNYWTGAWIAPTAGYPNLWALIAGISALSLLGVLGICRMIRAGYSVALLYAGCLFLYPLPYYVTTSQPRFYNSIAPLTILAAAFCVENWSKRPKPTAGALVV